MKSILLFFGKFNLKKAVLLMATPFIAIYSDYKSMMFGLLVLMLIDLYTGIQVYCKEHALKISFFNLRSWGIIKSAGLRKTMSKFKDYIMVILAFYFFEIYMLKAPLDIFDYNGTEMIIATLGVIELWSIGENYKKKRGYNIFEYIKKLLFQKDVKQVIKDISKNNENDKI